MGTSTTNTTNNRPYAPTRPMINQGLNDASNLYNSGGFQMDPFVGQTVAGFSEQQQQAQGMAGGVAHAGAQGAGASRDAVMRAMDPNARSAAFEQVKQNTIADIMPSINASFAGSGMTGSSLHQQHLAKGLAAGLGQVENDAHQQGEQRALQAAGMIPGINNASYGAVDFLNNVGGDIQNQNQTQINADMMQHQQSQSAEQDALQNYLALVTGTGSQFGVQSSTQQSRPGLASALGFGLQAAPLIFSDERLKTNIKRVGKTDTGLGVYTYSYKGSDAVHMGVMAQEVEKTNPQAVQVINGYKAVNYGSI